MGGVIGLGPGAGKCAFDALTDQSLASLRDHRHEADPDVALLAADMAAILAEQFPDDKVTAGRVAMACAQIADGLPWSDGGCQVVSVVTDMFALAAEQLVCEGSGAGSGS